MKVKVDKSLCIGCELCVQLCPAVFTMGADGFAEAIAGPIHEGQELLCREASESCPVNAIVVSE